MSVEEGAITCLVGSNGAGKSSLLQALSGIIACKKGAIHFDGKEITSRPSHERVEMGLVQVPDKAATSFPYMNVLEKLELGSILPRVRKKRKRKYGQGL